MLECSVPSVPSPNRSFAQIRIVALMVLLSAMSYFDRTPIGKVMTRVTNDTESVAELFSSGAVSIVGDLLFLRPVAVSLEVPLAGAVHSDAIGCTVADTKLAGGDVDDYASNVGTGCRSGERVGDLFVCQGRASDQQ